MVADKVTILVPTYQRPHFLRRLIGALHEMKFGGVLLIGDSSTPDNYLATDRILNEISPAYRVQHFSVPKAPGVSVSLSINQVLASGVNMISTPYAMLTCDDDVPVPQTLQACQAALDSDASLASAVGDFPMLYLKDNLNQNEATYVPFLTRIRVQPVTELAHDTAQARLTHFLTYFFNIMYSVVRKEHIRKIVPDFSYSMSFPHFSAEYLWFFTLALCGRNTLVDLPHVIRLKHSGNLGSMNPYPSMSEAILSSKWHYDAMMFVDFLKRWLVDVDGIREEDAFQAAQEAFAQLVGQRLLGTHVKPSWQSEDLRARTARYNDLSSPQRKSYEYAVMALMAHDVRV